MAATIAATVDFQRHGVERYGERVRAGVSVDAVEAELRAITQCVGRIVDEPPLWVALDRTTTAWLMIGDDIVFPLRGRADGRLVAIPCLIRGWRPPSVVAARRGRRARRYGRRGL